jgi:hypothetical protein
VEEWDQLGWLESFHVRSGATQIREQGSFTKRPALNYVGSEELRIPSNLR